MTEEEAEKLRQDMEATRAGMAHLYLAVDALMKTQTVNIRYIAASVFGKPDAEAIGKELTDLVDTYDAMMLKARENIWGTDETARET